MTRQIPTSADECYRLYREEYDIPDGMCEVCPCVDLHPNEPASCPVGKRLRYAYRMRMECAPIMVTGSRFYQPPQDGGQIEQIVEFPMIREE